MVISTDDGAGEIVTPGEDTRFYDDIRCLAADWSAHGQAGIPFVRPRGGSWIDGRSASYAASTARTAMGSGLAVFATTAEARAADAARRSLTWQDVVAIAGGRP